MDRATLSAMVVAFGVVILTTLGNTLLEWYRQRATNKNAAIILRRALVEELRSAQETADTNAQRADDPYDDGHLIVPVAEGYPIYEANIGQLGRLEPEEVSAVVRAYGHLRAEIENLAVFGRFQRNDGPVLQAMVDSKWAPILASNARDRSKMLSAAIAALEARK